MSSADFVPKPASAGSGQTAIAHTRSAYANIRTGPGTQYRDVGDVWDKSLVVYYPATRTSDNWYWVETQGVSGWVAGSVVTFEQAIGPGHSPSYRPTPYDQAVALWHWKGDSTPFNNLQAFVSDVKQRAPNLKQLWVKTSDGREWQGRYDRSTMAINGPQDITRYVQILQASNMEFHAWCVPHGLDVDLEASLIAATCNTPGVKSMVLDIEPYAGFWQGGREAIRPFMLKLRQMVGARFHIGMSVDPRPHHYESIFPAEWMPFVNSIHPQCYWATFRSTPEDTLKSMVDTWGGFGKPIIPALQGDAPISEQEVAHTLATQRHGFAGLSWWRYGTISQYNIVNRPVNVVTTPTTPTEPTDHFAEEILIVPNGPGFRSGTYTGRQEFQQYMGTWNWDVLHKNTEPAVSKVWTEYRANLSESGRYEIAVFIPARHSTTQRARYKIHGIKGTNTEVVVDIDQSRNRNRWVPIGIFDLVKGAPNAGRVFLNDVTGEADKEIAFDAVRFRRIVTVSPGGTSPTTPGTRPSIVNGVFVADGYDSPVGTAEQRRGTRVWPEGWSDASPFGRLYFVGTPSEAYHTGADLNWGRPYEDKGLPVYSTANGVVMFAGVMAVWGNIIIIRHDPLYQPGARVLYSRYAHVQAMKVKPGDRVKRGDQIAEIGDAFGQFVPHLHFDLSPTSILETRPNDWPAKNLAALQKNYIDPLEFIRNNRP